MKPKNHKFFFNDVAKEAGVHKDVVDDLITFYYAKVRKNLSDLTVVGRNKEKLKELQSKYKIKTLIFENFNTTDTEHIIVNCIPPNISIRNYLNKKTYLIDMTYGIHNYKNKYQIKKYVNGYDILYVQAAYQYMEWFQEGNFKEIIMDYKKAIELFLSKKYYLLC